MTRFRILFFLLLCLSELQLQAQRLPLRIPLTDGQKWGYADSNGKRVIPLQWDRADFFVNGKAMTFLKRDRLPDVACIINEQGQYLLRPEAGWTGMRQTDQGFTLNATDSNGKFGRIDATGQQTIPYEWDHSTPLPAPWNDSFLIVHRDGRSGIIDLNGQVTVPVKWVDIVPLTSSGKLMLIQVHDPDNTGGLNSCGLVDARTGRLLLEDRYHDIQFLQLQGIPYLAVTLASGNQLLPGTQVDSRRFYLTYPGLKPVALTDSALRSASRREKRLHQHVLFAHDEYSNYGLADTNGKIIIPCCDIWKTTPDSIFLRNYKITGTDSAMLTSTILNARTLMPYGPPERIVLFAHDQPAYDRGWGREEQPMVTVAPGYQSSHFYKDSLLYSVESQSVLHGRPCYFVQGRPPGSTHLNAYSAIVDSSLQYILPPQERYRYIRFEPEESLLIAALQKAEFRGAGNDQFIFTAQGQQISGAIPGQIIHAFRTHGQLFALIEYKGKLQLTDDSGRIITLPPNIGLTRPSQEHPLPAGILSVTDTNGKAGLMDVQGRIIFPRISFKYAVLKRVADDIWLGGDQNSRTYQLINSRNKPLVKQPGLKVYGVSSLKPTSPFMRPPEDAAGRLFIVSAANLDGSSFTFLLNDRGHAYYQTN